MIIVDYSGLAIATIVVNKVDDEDFAMGHSTARCCFCNDPRCIFEGIR